jgi:hypothetical protein
MVPIMLHADPPFLKAVAQTVRTYNQQRPEGGQKLSPPGRAPLQLAGLGLPQRERVCVPGPSHRSHPLPDPRTRFQPCKPRPARAGCPAITPMLEASVIQAAAALRIQSAWRARAARARVCQLLLKRRAVLCLQYWWRGCECTPQHPVPGWQWRLAAAKGPPWVVPPPRATPAAHIASGYMRGPTHDPLYPQLCCHCRLWVCLVPWPLLQCPYPPPPNALTLQA